MKLSLKVLCLGFALAMAPLAKADTITGSIRLTPAPGGTSNANSFDANSITFTPNTAQVDASTIKSSGPSLLNSYVGAMATLQSFTFNNAAGVALFTVSNTFDTLTFTITNLVAHVFTPASSIGGVDFGASLLLRGTGIFTETPTPAGKLLGYTAFTPTAGTFSLTSSTDGITGFQMNSTAAPTPEPSSLLLLGTGLIGAAAVLMRRRNAVTAY